MRNFIYGVILTFAVAFGFHHPASHASAEPLLDGYQAPPPALPSYAPGASSMLFLRMEGGTCTGVIVGRHTLLTATHCIALGGALKQVNDMDVDATIIANDGHDHVLIRVNRVLKGRVAKITKLPPVGARVYLWGNPFDLRSVLRLGTVAGRYMDDHEGEFDLIDVNVGSGDSGGAYFDSRGNVVAIVYGDYSADGGFRIGITHPFAFQPHQIEGLS